MDLNDIANYIAVTAIIPISGFIYFYATTKVPGKFFRRPTRRWRQTEIGRTLMYQKIAWLVFLIYVLTGIFSDYPLEDYVRLLMYSSLVALFWRVFFTLRRLQKKAPADHVQDETEEGPDSAAGSETADTPVISSNSSE